MSLHIHAISVFTYSCRVHNYYSRIYVCLWTRWIYAKARVRSVNLDWTF